MPHMTKEEAEMHDQGLLPKLKEKPDKIETPPTIPAPAPVKEKSEGILICNIVC